MNGYELLKKLKGLINAHAELDCSVHQTGYKDDYFNLFRTAHDNGWFETSAHPRLTGEAIHDYFYGDWLREDNAINNKRGKKLKAVLDMWDEWHYSLEKYGLQ